MAKKQTTKKVAEKKVTAPKAQPAMAGDAIRMYQKDTNINANIADGCLTEEQKVCVEQLDSAMVELPVMTLNRVVTNAMLRKYMEQADVDTMMELVGKTIENVPYMSTTKNELNGLVKARYDLGLEKHICFVIHTEGKAKGVDVSKCLESNEFSSQNEVILARGQQFLVKKIVMGEGLGGVYPIIHLYAI